MSAKSTLHAAWRVRGAGTRTSRTTVNQNPRTKQIRIQTQFLLLYYTTSINTNTDSVSSANADYSSASRVAASAAAASTSSRSAANKQHSHQFRTMPVTIPTEVTGRIEPTLERRPYQSTSYSAISVHHTITSSDRLTCCINHLCIRCDYQCTRPVIRNHTVNHVYNRYIARDRPRPSKSAAERRSTYTTEGRSRPTQRQKHTPSKHECSGRVRRQPEQSMT